MKYGIFFIILATLSLASCGSSTQQKTPEEAVRGFFENMNKKNFDQAKLYATEATQEEIGLYRTALNMSNPTEQKAMEKAFALDMKQLVCQELNGQMTCKVCCGADSSEAEVPMVSKDGKWFVNLPKGSIEIQ